MPSHTVAAPLQQLWLAIQAARVPCTVSCVQCRCCSAPHEAIPSTVGAVRSSVLHAADMAAKSAALACFLHWPVATATCLRRACMRKNQTEDLSSMRQLRSRPHILSSVLYRMRSSSLSLIAPASSGASNPYLEPLPYSSSAFSSR